MTPKELDWIAHGVPVHINRRHDGTLYTTIHDFSRFNVKPEATVRVPIQGLYEESDALNHPLVKQKMEELNHV